MNDHIVVYRSEAERAVDQWMWQHGGGFIVGGVALLLAAAVLILVVRDWWKGR